MNNCPNCNGILHPKWKGEHCELVACESCHCWFDLKEQEAENK